MFKTIKNLISWDNKMIIIFLILVKFAVLAILLEN
jgi:hypothetical protein